MKSETTFHCPLCSQQVDVSNVITDATADLQAQVEQLRGELAAARECVSGWMKENATGGWIANLRLERDHLRAALEKCVVALEHAWQHNHEEDCSDTPIDRGPQTDICELCKVVSDALATAKPLLNKP